MSAVGPSQTSGSVRCSVPVGNKADIDQRFADSIYEYMSYSDPHPLAVTWKLIRYA